MISNLSIAFLAIAKHMLTSLSVDEILLMRYVNWSTNFRGLPLKVEMAPSSIEHIISVLYSFSWRPMYSTACSRLCSWNSAWVGVFERRARSSVLFCLSLSFQGFFCFLSFSIETIFFY